MLQGEGKSMTGTPVIPVGKIVWAASSPAIAAIFAPGAKTTTIFT